MIRTQTRIRPSLSSKSLLQLKRSKSPKQPRLKSSLLRNSLLRNRQLKRATRRLLPMQLRTRLHSNRRLSIFLLRKFLLKTRPLKTTSSWMTLLSRTLDCRLLIPQQPSQVKELCSIEIKRTIPMTFLSMPMLSIL